MHVAINELITTIYRSPPLSLNYVIVLFLSNISCLQLCQMFYRGQLINYVNYTFKFWTTSRVVPPNFPSDLLHWLSGIGKLQLARLTSWKLSIVVARTAIETAYVSKNQLFRFRNSQFRMIHWLHTSASADVCSQWIMRNWEFQKRKSCFC